jgi:CheY-like chemotaxis protein
VEMHGGTVSVSSEGPGKGSEFVVRLPLLPAGVEEGTTSDALPAGAEEGTTPDARPNAPTAPTDSTAAPHGLRILLVDDNADMTRMLCVMLQRSGHEVRTAHSGAHALETALEFRPDVALLDIGLPDVNGYELARRIRRTPDLNDVVLVSVTGYGAASDRRRAMEAGFQHHLVKPAGIEDIERILRSILPSQKAPR